MADKQSTIWPLSPHTAAKHRILKNYLGAWFPKLQWSKRVVFVDGFAGPGEYSGGEPGSPIVALDAAVGHKRDLSDCELIYIFVEEDKGRFDNLSKLIDGMEPPAHVRIETRHGEFVDVVDELIEALEGKELAPAFVMIDPFGPKGLPLETLALLAQFPRSELLVSLMYEPITRFLSHPNFENHLDAMYGTPRWRDAQPLGTADRKTFLRELYAEQLSSIGMQYVRSFELIDDGGRTEYFLVYGTHHIDGLKAMKAAMWNVDPSGTFKFSDATHSNQKTLFEPQPDYLQLKGQIFGQFSGQEVGVETVEEFVVTETAFRETHYKRGVLAPAERRKEIAVTESPRMKRFTYPDGTVIAFPAK